jgi:hypothetical protein
MNQSEMDGGPPNKKPKMVVTQISETAGKYSICLTSLILNLKSNHLNKN